MEVRATLGKAFKYIFSVERMKQELTQTWVIGIFLDLDLKCERSLEPIRRLDFLAPEANPQGISNGFFAAKPLHPILLSAVEHLPGFNVNWVFLPYATVMASTGCQYFSTILAAIDMGDSDRVLAGPENEPHMHRLSGKAITPLFHHFGSSSWHSFDAKWFSSFTSVSRYLSTS